MSLMNARVSSETPGLAASVQDASRMLGSKPDRIAWFMDQGLGMFIHWNIDAQLGSVISHSMVGASPDYLERYIQLLPATWLILSVS